MPAKKVSIGTKPASVEKAPTLDEWVSNRTSEPATVEPVVKEQTVKMKRLTLDIPESLHRAIKMRAVEEGKAMADLLRELLEKHYL